MELNELFLAIIIIALVVLLLSAIYRFGMSCKSFEEILEEQKQSQISLLGKPKPEKKKEKKKLPATVNKKKSETSVKSEDDASHDEELLSMEKSKEVKTVVTAASKPVKRKVAKKHQEYNKVEELLVKEKAVKETNEKNSPVDTKVEKNDNSVTFGPATTKKPAAVNPISTKDQSILKSVAPAATDKISSAQIPRQNSKSPVTKTTTRSTDAGPVNTDAKKKKNKEVEIITGESEKIVAAAAPITKSAPSAAVSHKEHREHTGAVPLTKGLETKQGTQNLQKSSLVIRETTGNVKLTTTGSPSPNTDSEWTMKNQKGDPNVALKKLLDERDGELRMLQAQLQAANAKYNEARQELADNNQKFTAHDRTLKQQLSVKEQECVELRKRVSSGSGAAASGPIKGPSNDGQVQVIMHLTEENRQLKETILKLQQQVGQVAGQQQQQQQGADLKQQIKFMDEALKQNSKLLNTSENTRKTLEFKLKQTEDQLNLSNMKATDWEKRCHDAEDRLAKTENSDKSSVNEGEIKAYQAKLKEKEMQTTELEAQMKLLENKFSQLQQRLQNQDAELLSLRSRNGQSVNLNSGPTESHREADLLQRCDHLVGELESSKNAMRQLELSHNEKSEELRKAVEELNMLKMSHARDVEQQNEKITDLTAKLEEQNKIVAQLESIEKEKTLELEATKQELQKIMDKSNDADLQLERFSEVSNDLDRAKENLMRLESMNEEKSNELRKLSEEMSFYRNSQSDIESKDFQLHESIDELNKCKQTIDHLQSQLVSKDQELDKLMQDSTQHMQTVKTAQKEEYDRLLKDLEAQNEELRKLNYEKVCETCSNKQNGSSLDSEELQQTFIPNGSSHLNSSNSEEVEGYKTTISKLEEESVKKSQELQRVQEELELLRISNNDLVNQSQRLLEASDYLKKSKVDLLEVEQRSRTTSIDDNNIPLDIQKLSQLSNEVVRYKEDVDKLKRLSDEKQTELEKVLKELKDVQRVNQDLSARIESATNNFKDVPDSSIQTNGLEVQLVEAKESENKLQTEVQHYQTVLHDTERILRQLQDNVESEEQNWQQKLLSSQNQVHEYQDKIRQLERLLEESEAEKIRLKMNQDLTNGTSPSIDHKEERIRKADRAVVCPALEVQETN